VDIRDLKAGRFAELERLSCTLGVMPIVIAESASEILDGYG
jgi:hypothetical protein